MTHQRNEAHPLSDIMTAQNDNIAKIYTKYKKQLLQFIHARVNVLEDAEDILSEVFYQYTRINELADPVKQTMAWLYKVTRNKITDYYRKKRDIPFSDLGATSDSESDDPVSEIIDFLAIDKDTPETVTLRIYIWETLNAALLELPEAQREVFIKTEFEGLSLKEIAKNTGVSVNTLLSRKHYAVLYLREKLKDVYEGLDG